MKTGNDTIDQADGDYTIITADPSTTACVC
jgi:hypothetical protein